MPMVAFGELDAFYILAFLSLLLCFTGRDAIKKSRRLLKLIQGRGVPGIDDTGGGLFNGPRIQAKKNCPHCETSLPLAALICDGCEYNFLAARPGRRQELLPPPHPAVQESTEPSYASAGL
jgi:hypothetical protein